MNPREKPAPFVPSASEYILNNSDVLTPEGPTPRGSFRSDSFRSNRRTERANDAGGMGRL
jgi:hypothetical protein